MSSRRVGFGERLSQGLQQFTPVDIKAAVHLTDGLLFHHPQLAVRLSDQPLVVTHDNHTCNTQPSDRHHNKLPQHTQLSASLSIITTATHPNVYKSANHHTYNTHNSVRVTVITHVTQYSSVQVTVLTPVTQRRSVQIMVITPITQHSSVQVTVITHVTQHSSVQVTAITPALQHSSVQLTVVTPVTQHSSVQGLG